MLIKLKNKDTLIIDEFKFKCCIGKSGINSKKIEGDNCTPSGKYRLKTLYYRSDRVKRPLTKINIKKIKKNIGWCNDIYNKSYNREIKINKNIKHEKLYRSDYKYNYFIVIEYNTQPVKFNKGSAIFLHLTKNYQKTAGCIAVNQKDFLIILKIINKKTKIII